MKLIALRLALKKLAHTCSCSACMQMRASCMCTFITTTRIANFDMTSDML
ncbi:hypothetical protein GMORB2_5067 [Geosmithia morbida]|uniref:Uncharacterized protein n=1 Tax=Geosmithia morbida TaxID=1094350 RepID=A0A9P4YWJ0_9HYPO|nr:uncharacterized protein GMORB2_5067 [Geosmithia morbida]KAF4124401.1 hypothetical protein GMORB2_5067 [Geosmithia morbida]